MNAFSPFTSAFTFRSTPPTYHHHNITITTPDDEYVRAFNGDTNEQPEGAVAGYGIDPRQADADEMAAAFNADVSVGGPMATREIEARELPQASGDMPVKSAEPATKIQVTEKTATPNAPPEFKTFGQAFKWHREQNLKNGRSDLFDWKGEKFTTKLRSEVKAPTGKSSPAKAAATPAGKTGALATSPAAGKASPAIDRSKTLAFKEATGTPSSPAPYSPALP